MQNNLQVFCIPNLKARGVIPLHPLMLVPFVGSQFSLKKKGLRCALRSHSLRVWRRVGCTQPYHCKQRGGFHDSNLWPPGHIEVTKPWRWATHGVPTFQRRHVMIALLKTSFPSPFYSIYFLIDSLPFIGNNSGKLPISCLLFKHVIQGHPKME